ncbi:uncharacterized protein LOC142320492 isoform X2 [Lycorma delicatula]|uniref:uncharacterized protein LOC142320492 isoform X2 n=1 Tax=Lycorma delicatula TaxID=130591 RepID=UPI003F50D8A8
MSLNYYQIIHLYQRFVILQILSHLHCRKEVTSMDNPLILIENGCDDLHLGKDIIILANLPADQTDFYLCSQIVKAVASSGSKILNEQPMAGSEADNEQETGFLTKIKKSIFG